MAFGVPDASGGGKQFIGDIMMIGAGIAWGATTLVIKGSNLRTAPAEKVLAYQLAVSIPMMALGAAAAGRAHDSHAERLVARLARLSDLLGGEPHLCGVVRHGAALFGEPIIGVHIPDPLFGVASGHFVLGEPISWAFGVAVALVIAGLVLVNRPN